MADQRGIAYEDLEIQIDDKPNKDGVNVQETLRRLHFQTDQRYHQVPTEDLEVRRLLRLLREPESTAGENEYARRGRLIELLVSNKAHMNTFEATLLDKQSIAEGSDTYEDEEDEEFYTPARQELIKARKFLVGFSIHNARKRLKRETQDAISFDMKREIKERRNLAQRLKNLALAGSQVASTRPISHVRLSPDDCYAAIGSWDGSLKTISTKNLEVLSVVEQAHNGKVGEVDWNATGDLLATGGEDGQVKLFSAAAGELRPTIAFEGHERRVAGTKFHPSGKYVASCSFDKTWRLWDIQTQQELLLQEGHSREVYCIAFHSDGALLCSGGFDCTPVAWDIRSGKSVMSLAGHMKPVYSVDWSPNGYHLATAGGDGTVNVWDVRKSTQAQTILAHDSTVSVVRFNKLNGKFLMSGSYDKNIKVYSSDNWVNVAVLKGHVDKILTLDIDLNGNMVVSGGWDRSVKLWTQD
ncbi:hypothetical protein HG536_0F00410 [Torulaspora globosa]|uniref:Pre-mRNA processing factor 4 (PRP4)-like domain-containing protein n=1 Tax=Torulaspora globosa TaxID=48254 RepID=A0A7G3ZJN1_9SACH|nr:uncharacterized protein HG536_0F00410 [Torulaspora globosa]QLL33717.1 hypothetical protein HG536_0F00410 [Torulaspora globosa]